MSGAAPRHVGWASSQMITDPPETARPLLRRAAPPAADGTIVEVSVASAGWDFADIAALPARRWPACQPARRRPRAARPRARGSRACIGRRPRLRHPRNRVPRCSTDRPRRSSSSRPGRPVEVVAETRRHWSSSPRRPAARSRSTRLIAPSDILVEARGSGQTARRIHHLLPPGAEAGRLIAYEVFTPGGNWSSYPPHKHDTEDPPVEARLEEIYFYRFAKPQGFAFQRVYTPDGSLDESMTPRRRRRRARARGATTRWASPPATTATTST